MERVREIRKEVDAIRERMGLGDLELSIHFDMNAQEPIPYVSKVESVPCLTIPHHFLINPEDQANNTRLYRWIKTKLSQNPMGAGERAYLDAFYKYLENPEMAHKAKQFILYHELSHLRLGHLEHADVSDAISRQQEQQADLLAAEYGNAEGGAYLFSVLKNYPIPELPTHPTYKEREAYLRELFPAAMPEVVERPSLCTQMSAFFQKTLGLILSPKTENFPPKTP